MKSLIITILIITSVIFNTIAQGTPNIEAKYTGVEQININLVHGDVQIKPSTSGKIKIEGYFDQDLVKGAVQIVDEVLQLKEELLELNYTEKHKSNWVLFLPDDVQVEMNSSTGNISIDQFKGQLEASSGTGNIKAKNLSITQPSSLSSGTGNTEVHLIGNQVNAKLSISSAMGNTELNLDDADFQGVLKMACDKREGEIASEFDFDREWIGGNKDLEITKLTYTVHRGKVQNAEKKKGVEKSIVGDEILYKEKSFGNSNVTITISTGTGTATLKKSPIY